MSPSSSDPSNRPVHGESSLAPLAKKGAPIAAWLVPLLLLLAVGLFLATRGCGHRELGATKATDDASPATPSVAVKKVVLPGGGELAVEPSSLGYLLQAFLASPDPAPRTFVFERMNFATASADLPPDAQQTVDGVAQILKAYPTAKVRLDGYADARGTEQANSQLGARRAEAVATALEARGIGTDRVTTATGSDKNPVATNATPAGRAENRRTELVVITK